MRSSPAHLLKNSWFQNFTQAVLQVVNGGATVSPNVVRHFLMRLRRSMPDEMSQAGSTPPKALSMREREVLLLVAKGCLTRDIATELSISAQTVCAHVKSICHKLQVRTRAHAVTAAVSRDLI